jgi:cobalamin biosynthesis protein CobD/CbiB
MAVELLLAYLLDLTLGDPPHWPHPVRWLGRLITALEPPLRRHVSDARFTGPSPSKSWPPMPGPFTDP